MSDTVMDESDEAQKVGWFELFYDLVVVASVGLSTHFFSEHPSFHTATVIAVSLGLMFSLWLLTSLNHGLFPGDSPVRQVLVLVQMAFLAIAALSYTNGDEGIGTAAFVSLAAASASIAVLYALYERRTHAHVFRASPRDDSHVRAGRPMALGAFAATAVFVVGAILVVPAESASSTGTIFYLIGLGCLAIPLLTIGVRRIVALGIPNAEHLEERLGLLVLIVLGESFVHLLGSLAGVSAIPNMYFFVVTLAVTFALWSLYFSSIHTFGLPLNASGLRQWLAAHFLFIFGATALAAELASLTLIAPDADVPTTQSGWTTLPFLYILIALAWMTWIAQRRRSAMLWTHLIAIAILVVLLYGESVIPEDDRRWLVLGACLLVLVDAVLSAIYRVRARREVSPSFA